jgi:hypothetical protein
VKTLILCLALAACADAPVPASPGFPCGPEGVVCEGADGGVSGMCCPQYSTCGGGLDSVGCPAGECCDIGSGAFEMHKHTPQTPAKP